MHRPKHEIKKDISGVEGVVVKVEIKATTLLPHAYGRNISINFVHLIHHITTTGMQSIFFSFPMTMNNL